MSNPFDSEKPLLSPSERWRNVCEAMAETLAEDQNALRGNDDSTDDILDAVSLKMDLMHLARPDESPEEHIHRLSEEVALLVTEDGYHRDSDESVVEYVSRVLQSKAFLKSRKHILVYLQKIRELEKAVGPSSSLKRGTPTQEPLKNQKH